MRRKKIAENKKLDLTPDIRPALSSQATERELFTSFTDPETLSSKG